MLFGLFGVGGSSFATPALGLLGVGGLVAVAAPLPTIPAAVVGTVAYVRRHQVEWPVARWSIYGGVLATIIGALLSQYVGATPLLIASGVVLAAVGVRILLPLPEGRLAGLARRRAAVVVPAAAAIGLFTGLLANGGGFLLVPVFVVVLGLTMPESAGTSLVVIAVLSVPTLATHWALGHNRLDRRRRLRRGRHSRRSSRIAHGTTPPCRRDETGLRHPADRLRRLLRHPTDRQPVTSRPTQLRSSKGQQHACH